MFENESARSPYEGLAQRIRGGPSPAAAEYASRAPVMQIQRPSDRSGLVGKLRLFNLFGALIAQFEFEIHLDGERVGSLARSSKLSLDIAPGEHVLQIKTPVARSRRLPFSIENGQRIRFTCQTKLTGIILQRRD